MGEKEAGFRALLRCNRATAQDVRKAVSFHLACVLVAVWATACSREAPLNLPTSRAVTPVPDSEIVATVAGAPITAQQFRRALARSGADIPGRYDTLEEKQALLDELIRVKALAAAGRELGYDTDPEIIEVVDRFLADKYLREVNRINPGPTPPSADEVQAYYEAHKADYTPAERARASVIVLRFPPQASDEQKKAVLARAENIRAQALEKAAIPGTFATLAKEQSEDPTSRNRGGDIGWLAKGAKDYRLDSRLVEAVFAIEKPGDVGPVVETREGAVVVRLTERTKAEAKPLSEVEASIRQTLLAERQKALSDHRMRELAERFPVQVKRDVLAKMGLPAETKSAGPRPPSFPVGVP